MNLIIRFININNNKININMQKDNKITIIGVGKLGLGLGLLFEKHGYDVLGIDKNTEYVNTLNSKQLNTIEPHYNQMLSNSKNIKFSYKLQDGIEHSDYIYILIQTPNSGGEKFYDHSFLSNLLSELNSYKLHNKHIIIGCTVMPNYINQIGSFLLDKCVDCSLSYNPEFVAQGNVIDGFANPDFILIGTHSKKVECKLKEIYDKTSINKPKYCIMSPLEAEITKISINGFITTKLSFANMISDVCDNLGANKEKVLNSIGTDSRIGNNYFKVGYSYGGPCFPRDTKALNLFVTQSNIPSDLLTATSKYNDYHIKYQADQLLEQNKGQDTFEFDNVSFKQTNTTTIIEESAKLKIAKYLVHKGKRVIIKDIKPIIDEVKKEYGNLFTYYNI